jgi:hypothetical protein
MITQKEFEILLAYKKRFKEDEQIDLYLPEWQREIVSVESTDTFILNYRRGTINFEKYTFNNRNPVIVLLRFDSLGRHTNPDSDGRSFSGPHVHIYREGFGDKIAFPVSEIGLSETDLKGEDVLPIFLRYCNVLNLPSIQTTLFLK